MSKKNLPIFVPDPENCRLIEQYEYEYPDLNFGVAVINL